MFLKANDSINDQPQDNGPNAMLKAFYSEAYEEWQETLPNASINVGFFNEIISVAWGRYLASPKRVDTIIKAFAKTGLYPFVCPTQQLTESTSQKISLSELYVADEADQAAFKKLKSECMDARHKIGQLPQIAHVPSSAFTVADPSIGVPLSDDQTAKSSSSASLPSIAPKLSYEDVSLKTVISLDHIVTPGSDPVSFKMVLSKAVFESLQKSTIMPAQQLQQVYKEQNEMKKINIPKNASQSCRFPSTKTGLCVTVGHSLEQIRQVKENREAKAAEEALRAEQTALKNSQKLVLSNELKTSFLADVDELGENWKLKYKKRDELWAVYKALGGKAAAASLKVGEIAGAIDNLLDEV
jgi:hypothetical protein